MQKQSQYSTSEYHYIIINNKKWYHRLLDKSKSSFKPSKGLFSDYSRENISKELIVSMSYRYDYGQNSRPLFALFKSFLEFAMYCKFIPDNNKYFYEIILGENPQKPHFDIDIDDPEINGEQVKDFLVNAIINVLADRGVFISINNILIYTSHGFNNKNKYKQSYHVVINNYCHANNVEARAFYEKVLSYVPEDYRIYIDNGVYSPTQQFRIVGSTKINNNRNKTFQKKWDYKGTDVIHQYPEEAEDVDHETVMQLEESLITFTGNCSFLPTFQPKEKEKIYEDCEEVVLDEARSALELVASKENTKTDSSSFPYIIEDINGPIVELKRVRPSFCQICSRVHEHQNPYLLIIGEEKAVYFHCRRADRNKKLYLGKLLEKEKDEDTGPDNIQPEAQIEIPNRDRLNNMKTMSVQDILSDLISNAESNSKVRKIEKPVNGATETSSKYNSEFLKYSIAST